MESKFIIVFILYDAMNNAFDIDCLDACDGMNDALNGYEIYIVVPYFRFLELPKKLQK